MPKKENGKKEEGEVKSTARWIKVDVSDEGDATYLDLKKALRFDFRSYSDGSGGRVRVYFSGTDIDISSDNDPEAYDEISSYVGHRPTKRRKEEPKDEQPDEETADKP
jgi:hypothetical protein